MADAALHRGATVAVLDLELSGAPDGANAIIADVTDDGSVVAAVAEAASTMGGIDVLVNNAGIGAQGTIEANALDEWRHVFNVNVLGIVRVVRAALAHLRGSPNASVVNMCSIRGDRRAPRTGRVQRVQGRRAVADDGDGCRPRRRRHSGQLREPGHRRYAMGRASLDQASDPAAERAALEARQPIGRLVTADEVAAAVLYLGGPAAGSTTGTALAVDGGMSGLRLRRAPATNAGGNRGIHS